MEGERRRAPVGATVWRALAVSMLAVLALGSAGGATERKPLPVTVHVDAERYEITGEQNTLVGVRRAPVPHDTLGGLTGAVQQAAPAAAAARLTRSTPPEVIDYVLGVTEDGVLIVAQQVRRFDGTTGRYAFVAGEIMRAYPALEATVPWMWIIDIPLGREVNVTLEVTALNPGWPVRGVALTPKVLR
jgi:hypothetical protein